MSLRGQERSGRERLKKEKELPDECSISDETGLGTPREDGRCRMVRVRKIMATKAIQMTRRRLGYALSKSEVLLPVPPR